MFNIWIIILCHSYPDKLKNLINSLIHESINIYVHIDTSSKDDFSHFKNNERVTFFSIFSTWWWSWELVAATLFCLEKAINSNQYFIVISWEDYPLKNIDYIYKFFLKNKNYNFLDYRKYKGDFWWWIKVYNDYYYIKFKKVIFPIPLKKKRIFDLYYSSQWINVNQNTAIEILDYVHNTPSIISYFKYSYNPDNFFFATIIWILDLYKKTMNHSLRFILWDESSRNRNILLFSLNLPFFIHPRTPTYIDKSKITKNIFWDKFYLFFRKIK